MSELLCCLLSSYEMYIQICFYGRLQIFITQSIPFVQYKIFIVFTLLHFDVSNKNSYLAERILNENKCFKTSYNILYIQDDRKYDQLRSNLDSLLYKAIGCQ